jgi:hypothetical protein
MSSRDSDRPLVLAHQGFLEDKESFAGLSLEQRVADQPGLARAGFWARTF